jgi:hypothetical protein
MNPSLRINSSSIAALAGKNPYVSIADAVLTVWKSSDKNSYAAAHERCCLETPEQRKQRIKDAYPAIDAIARTTKPSLLASSLAAFSFLDDPQVTKYSTTATPSTTTPPISKKEIMDTARETAYTEHGITRESIVLDRVNTVMGTHFKEDDTLWTQSIGSTPSGRDVIVQGRIDAIDVPHILEIKTRARGLFMHLKEYEKLQIESYMLLTHTDTAFLAEAYFPSRQSTDPDLNIIRVDRNDESIRDWVNHILDAVQVVDRLVSDEDAQDMFLKSKHRNAILKHWMDESSTPS